MGEKQSEKDGGKTVSEKPGGAASVRHAPQHSSPEDMLPQAHWLRAGSEPPGSF